jgi:hypothetical protein
MPTDEALDEMAIKLTGHPFAAQPGPAEKAMIMGLAIQADISADTNGFSELLNDIKEALQDLRSSVSSGVAQLEEIDKSIVPIMEWFEKSKLWEGEAWVRS